MAMKGHSYERNSLPLTLPQGLGQVEVLGGCKCQRRNAKIYWGVHVTHHISLRVYMLMPSSFIHYHHGTCPWITCSWICVILSQTFCYSCSLQSWVSTAYSFIGVPQLEMLIYIYIYIYIYIQHCELHRKCNQFVKTLTMGDLYIWFCRKVCTFCT